MAPGPLVFQPLPSDDPLHRALLKVGELYTATNFATWWDARAFAVDGPGREDWDPADREQWPVLASFVEQHVLPGYARGQAGSGGFSEQVAKVGRAGWSDVREGVLDALRHHPTAGGTRPGTPGGQFSPHAFMLLDILEDQVAAALGLGSGKDLVGADGRAMICARLRPRDGSVFEGTLYQHLFLIWAPRSGRLLWFDLGGSA
jgi:hypothetical protein